MLAAVVRLLGQAADRVEKDPAEAFGVLREDAEYLLLGDAMITLDARVKIGHERDGRVADGQLACEYSLWMTCHIDDGSADARVPPGLGPRREARPFDNDHRAARQLSLCGFFHGASPRSAVRVGEVHVHRALVVERLNAPDRTVNQLVRQYERARPELRSQAADGTRREDLAYPDGVQGPEVRPIGNAVRGI